MKKLMGNVKVRIAILFVVIFLIHLVMNYEKDDLWFAEQLNLQTYGEFLSMRYHNWTSRLIIEAALITITPLNMNVWRVLDTFLFIVGVSVALKLIDEDNDGYIHMLGWLFFLSYPFLEMSSAGWAATTMNYLWCFSLGMVSFLPLINMEHKKKTPVFQYVLSLACLVYAINQEQMCALVLAFQLLYFVRGLKEHKKICKYNLVCIALSVASILFIMECPGNAVRMAAETQSWYPEFAGLGLWEKAYLGIVQTANVLISNISERVVLFIFSVVLTVAVFVYAKNRISKGIAGAFLVLVSGITIFKSLPARVFPLLEQYFNVLDYQGVPTTEDFGGYLIVMAVVSAICLFVCIGYLLFVVFGTKQLLPQFLFWGGVCSRFIMGWSPTIFQSGERTACFLCMALIMVCIFLSKKMYMEKKMPKKAWTVATGLLGAYVILNLGHVAVHAIFA